MDFGFWLDVLSMGLRLLHVVVGIAWIGSSFYFVWLDNSIREPTDPDLKDKGVLGELWAMHAGGFYNPQKYVVAPKQLPETLHWFFWPSYSTWISGFLLITTLYYLQASSYMVDPSKAQLSARAAVHIGILTLIVGWLVYDGLCRLLINRNQLLFAAVYTLFVTAMSYGLFSVLAGRAAFIHVGAMIATAMTGNVFFVIIPAQRKIVAAMKAGLVPDAAPGKRAKQRSVHNNYLTLPVLLCMISNHYAFTYNHAQGWLVLVGLMLGTLPIRHFFNLKHKGQYRWEYPIAAGSIFLVVLLSIMPTPGIGQWANVPKDFKPHEGTVVDFVPGKAVTLADARAIVDARCIACHADHPILLPAAPAGVLLDSEARLRLNAKRVLVQACQLKNMPQGNVTRMTDIERQALAAWINDGMK